MLTPSLTFKPHYTTTSAKQISNRDKARIHSYTFFLLSISGSSMSCQLLSSISHSQSLSPSPRRQNGFPLQFRLPTPPPLQRLIQVAQACSVQQTTIWSVTLAQWPFDWLFTFFLQLHSQVLQNSWLQYITNCVILFQSSLLRAISSCWHQCMNILNKRTIYQFHSMLLLNICN